MIYEHLENQTNKLIEENRGLRHTIDKLNANWLDAIHDWKGLIKDLREQIKAKDILLERQKERLITCFKDIIWDTYLDDDTRQEMFKQLELVEQDKFKSSYDFKRCKSD